MKILLLLTFWGLWFLNFSARSGLSPLLPIIENELGISHALAGSLFFFISIGFTTSVFMSGFVSNLIGYKRSILFSLLLVVLVLVGFCFADTYTQFVIVCLFVGLGGGLYLPCAIPLITSIFSRDNWGKVIAFHETAASSSFLAIPILVALMLRFFHWRSFFIFISGSFFVILILFWILAPDIRPQREEKAPYAEIIKKQDFWILTGLWVIAAMSTAGFYGITPLFLVNEKGMALKFANTVFGISRVGGLFATLLTGFVLDRLRLKIILRTILLVTGTSTIIIAISTDFWLLVSMLVIQATISVTFFPTAITTISRLTHMAERSTFMGLTLAISSILGAGLTPVIMGVVADQWSFGVGIFFMGLLAILSCLFINKLSLFKTLPSD